MVTNNMRLSGLASGMDIDQMVKDLMSAHRKPLEKMVQSKTVLEWQRDSYRNVNTKILEFRNLMFDNMKLTSNFNEKTATMAVNDSIDVSSKSTAPEGTYQIKVNKVAENAKLTSLNAVGAKALQGLETKLTDLGLSGDTLLTIGGEKGTASIQVKGTDSVDSLVKSINDKSSVTGVKISYDTTLDHFFFTSSNTGSTAKVNLQTETETLLTKVLKVVPDPSGLSTTAGNLIGGIGNGSDPVNDARSFAELSSTKIDPTLTADQKIKLAYNGVESEFTITSTTSIGSLISQINSSNVGKQGVSAFLDSNNQLSFTTPTAAALTITDIDSDSKNSLIKLGVHKPDGTSSLEITARNYYTANDADGGVDAEVEYNGVTGTYSTNSFEINGMSFTAKAVGAIQTVTVTQNTDAIFDKVKGFVDKYNELIDSVNKTLDEKKNRSFTPLSAEQKAEMSEDDIKLWEEKAKSGLLRNDQVISSALNGFRQAIFSVVSGLPSDDLKQLSQIGITTGSYSEKGKLYINPTELKKAIAEHPDEVTAMFTASDGDKTTNSADGIVTRLIEQADTLMANLKTKAGSISSVDTSYTIGKRMREYDKRMDALSLRMEALETKYYNQFTAMEKYINQMNTQSSYLAQQFGG